MTADSDPVIALVTTGLGWGGTEVVASSLAIEFKRMGLNAALIADGPPLDRLPILQDAGVPVSVIGVEADWPPGRYRASLAAELRKSNAALMHCHIWERLEDVFQAGRDVGIPYAMTVHATVTTSWRLRMGLVGNPKRFAANRRAYADYDPLIVNISKLSDDGFRSLHPRVSRTRLIYLGTPAPAAPVDAGAGDKTIQALWVGSFIERKRPIWMLDCWRHVVTRCPGARLVMLGDGPQLDQARQLAATLPPGSVELTGATPHVDTYMAASQLLVHSAVREGLPAPIVQAANFGVPVVACRAGAIPEAVEDGRTGYLTGTSAKSAFVDRICTLASDSMLRRSMGLAARALGEQTFGYDRYIDEHLRLYSDLCGVDLVARSKRNVL